MLSMSEITDYTKVFDDLLNGEVTPELSSHDNMKLLMLTVEGALLAPVERVVDEGVRER
jgi:hypothetical protein